MTVNNIMNTYKRIDVILEKGKGAKVYDVDGNEYLDFVSGIAVNTLGHSHPAIIKTLEKQCRKLLHVSNLYWNTKQLELAEKLVKNSDLHKVFFCNSGTEAVEAAIKLGRKYGKLSGGEKKNEIIFMENSFHGRTLGALAITGQNKYKKDFMPLMEGVKSVKFNDIQELQNNINNNTCCVIIEPIQGEGGINVVNKKYLEELRKLCNKFDSLLIFDEVQCGIGRTANLFAYQGFGVVPDVICMAKGLGGGFPIGAVLASEKAAGAFEPGDHGSTFGGNPLACAVSLAVLDELLDGGVLEKIEMKSKYLINKLKELQNKYKVIKDIKGMGLIIGISLESKTKEFVQICFDKGLLLVTAGNNVVRLLPPLNVKTEEIDCAVSIMDDVFNTL